MARVEIRNVAKWFEKGPGVRNINLDIASREFFVLVGPSGCGKSTILRMIAGLEESSQGQIFIDSEEVTHLPPKDRRIAMVFQNYALYPHMTVWENMAFGLKLRGYSPGEIETRVREAASILNIDPLLNRKPNEISGGERQRVAVGRAIVRKPKVFLFDEPLSNLDPKFRVQMRAEIIQLHKRLQTTMIYVTHDQVEAMTMGDRIGVIREGTVQQVAQPLELYARPVNRFVAEFIGSPSMNFFEVVVNIKASRVWLDQGHFQILLPGRFKPGSPLSEGQKLILGVRPEDIRDTLFTPGEAGEGNTILAMTVLVEPVGSESYVHLEVGGTRFIARMDPNNPTQVNQPMEVSVNLEKIHLFSCSDEQNTRIDF